MARATAEVSVLSTVMDVNICAENGRGIDDIPSISVGDRVVVAIRVSR